MLLIGTSASRGISQGFEGLARFEFLRNNT
jgi:hypothetical protein